MKLLLTFLFLTVGTVSVIFAQNSRTFEYTGKVQRFVVPHDVTSIDVEMYGAAGGNSIWEDDQYDYYEPGLGGKMTCTYPVKPGETIFIYVGGKGGDANGTTPGKSGFNGGGKGATSEPGYGPYSGGGGGGASDIRIGGNELKYRVLVVGGGGGAAANQPDGGDHGGDGGDMKGEDGQGSDYDKANPFGRAGHQTEGGKGGQYLSYDKGDDGRLGFGGNAPNLTSGGGGGGGYFGGGAGCWSGGGGGSSWSNSKATDVEHEQGIQEGNGMIIINFDSESEVDCSEEKVIATTTNMSICEGETIRLFGQNCDTYEWSDDVINGKEFEPDYGITTYYVTGKSQGGQCISTDSIQIVVNDMEIGSIVTYNEVTGLGIADIQVIGYGQAPYHFNWNDEAENEEGHFEDLETGGYQVEVTDATGCIGIKNVKIVQQEPLVLTADTNDQNAGQNYALSAQTNEDQSFVTVSYKGAFEFQIVDKGNNVVRNGHAVDSKKVDISSLPAGTYKVQLIFKTVQEEVSFTKN